MAPGLVVSLIRVSEMARAVVRPLCNDPAAAASAQRMTRAGWRRRTALRAISGRGPYPSDERTVGRRTVAGRSVAPRKSRRRLLPLTILYYFTPTSSRDLRADTIPLSISVS